MLVAASSGNLQEDSEHKNKPPTSTFDLENQDV
jgi:hypothetical protein